METIVLRRMDHVLYMRRVCRTAWSNVLALIPSALECRTILEWKMDTPIAGTFWQDNEAQISGLTCHPGSKITLRKLDSLLPRTQPTPQYSNFRI